jgi:hypothetical protein
MAYIEEEVYVESARQGFPMRPEERIAISVGDIYLAVYPFVKTYNDKEAKRKVVISKLYHRYDVELETKASSLLSTGFDIRYLNEGRCVEDYGGYIEGAFFAYNRLIAKKIF